jgi:hypothetical protein
MHTPGVFIWQTPLSRASTVRRNACHSGSLVRPEPWPQPCWRGWSAHLGVPSTPSLVQPITLHIFLARFTVGLSALGAACRDVPRRAVFRCGHASDKCRRCTALAPWASLSCLPLVVSPCVVGHPARRSRQTTFYRTGCPKVWCSPGPAKDHKDRAGTAGLDPRQPRRGLKPLARCRIGESPTRAAPSLFHPSSTDGLTSGAAGAVPVAYLLRSLSSLWASTAASFAARCASARAAA